MLFTWWNILLLIVLIILCISLWISYNNIFSVVLYPFILLYVIIVFGYVYNKIPIKTFEKIKYFKYDKYKLYINEKYKINTYNDTSCIYKIYKGN